MSKKTFSILSLGCFRNTYDSEIIAENFLGKGYKFIPESTALPKGKAVDTFIINTCGFIDAAKKESLNTIKEAIALKKKGKIKRLLVSGCLAQRYRKDLEKFFPQVDSWSGIEKLPQKFKPRKKLMFSYIAFVKICEGCCNNCSYCAIPFIKGSLVSRPKSDIISEVKYLDAQGIKELNIIGQDITSYGRDFKNGEDLTSLLKAILQQSKNIPWVRLFYLHPAHITDSLLELIANEERICKYIDIPLQHINDRLLELMGRPTTKSKILSLIKKIRKKIPGCALRTSVIAGFPTETEKELKELLGFIKETKFTRLGAFCYSREENTPAYNFRPQIHPKVKQSRFKQMMSLQQNISLELNKRLIGQSIEVLVEQKDNGIFIGRSEFHGYEVDGVVYVKRQGLKIGEFYKATITDAYEYDLVGI